MKSNSLDNNPDVPPWEFFNQANNENVRLLLLLSGTLEILYIGSCGRLDMFSMTESASSVFIRAAPRPPFHCTRFTRNAISDQNFAIQGRNLSYSVTSKNGKFIPILQDCSISIPPGQLWMLLGPNGCGKSTLLKVLAGLLSPTHGTACVKRPKSFVFQNPDHQVVMPTVEADVAFGIGKFNLIEDEVRSRVTKALDAVGMSNYLQRPVQTLSGGQKQRVAIAGALAATCKVLLLDELTTFLDANDQFGVIKAVKNCMVADGDGEVTALWVTHRLEEVEFADGAIYMENGRVIMHDCNASNVMAFVQQRMSQYSQHINS